MGHNYYNFIILQNWYAGWTSGSGVGHEKYIYALDVGTSSFLDNNNNDVEFGICCVSTICIKINNERSIYFHLVA